MVSPATVEAPSQKREEISDSKLKRKIKELERIARDQYKMPGRELGRIQQEGSCRDQLLTRIRMLQEWIANH